MQFLKSVFRDFREDDCPTMAAALAYYTVFALPSLLLLIMTLVGVFMDPQDVEGRIVAQFESMMGSSAGDNVREMIVAANQKTDGSGFRVVLSVAGLLFGATGAFLQLQNALNRAWEVKPDGSEGGVRNFAMKRLLSFGMILALAFLLLVSLALSALLTAFGDAIGALLGGVSDVLLKGLQLGLSLVVITTLFAVIFRFLPDAVVQWKDVWIGAGVTAGMFVLGKFLIGLYLGKSNPGDAFGGAGALAVLLVWIYYSSMIVLFGAEFTQKWAVRRGGGIVPEEGAIRTGVGASNDAVESTQSDGVDTLPFGYRPAA